MSPDVNIYHHARGFSVFYLSPRGQEFQNTLRRTYMLESWPAIDELVRLMRVNNIVFSYSQAEGIVFN